MAMTANKEFIEAQERVNRQIYENSKLRNEQEYFRRKDFLFSHDEQQQCN